MVSTLSKKTINLTYMQALDVIAKKHEFQNYQHFKETGKFKIAVFSRKGGVGKTTISLNL